MIISLSLLL